MNRAIEFEQTLKIRHQVAVEVDDESTLDTICNLTGDSFDDILSKIEAMPNVNMLGVSEEYSCDADDGLEYYDDYWTEEEERFYVR